MHRTNIYLDDEQTSALDRLAAEEGVSRAEVVRRLIDRGLAGGDGDLAADLGAIDVSFGSLAEIEYPERESGERERHLEQIWHDA
ncbi:MULTISPECIES: ribbon-helix-helix domain-containing protein [Humibacter]|jgi:hypothetical protein